MEVKIQALLDRLESLLGIAECIIERKTLFGIRVEQDKYGGHDAPLFNEYRDAIEFQMALNDIWQDVVSFIDKKGVEGINKVSQLVIRLKKNFGLKPNDYGGLVVTHKSTIRDIFLDANELPQKYVDGEGNEYCDNYVMETFNDYHFIPFIQVQYDFINNSIEELNKLKRKIGQEDVPVSNIRNKGSKRRFQAGEKSVKKLREIYRRLSEQGSKPYIKVNEKTFVDFFMGDKIPQRIVWYGSKNELHYLVDYIINNKIAYDECYWKIICYTFVLKGEIKITENSLKESNRISSSFSTLLDGI